MKALHLRLLRSIQLAFCVFAFLPAVLHLLVNQEEKFENDISRYIRKQDFSKSKKYNMTLSVPGFRMNETNVEKRKIEIENKRSIVEKKDTLNKILDETSIYNDNSLSSFSRETESEGSGLYWNLSCPLELSMFSGAHMGEDYLKRAFKARELAKQIESEMEKIDWEHLRNRRIFFVGDSLLRQVFISMACLNWKRVTNYAIPWFEKRSVRTRQPNTIGKGPHSKFEEGRVKLQGNIELIFHHGIGKMLELGNEYQGHDPNSWVKACYMKKTFDTVTPKFNALDAGDMSVLNVERETLTLKPSDIVLINASVHSARDLNLQSITDLFRCQKQMNHSAKSWPTFMYIMTGLSHFPTETGAFEEELLEKDDDYFCRIDSSFHGYQDDEVKRLDGILPILGTKILEQEFQSGDLHVGGKDCLHWLQPGIPDLVAADIASSIVSMAKA